MKKFILIGFFVMSCSCAHHARMDYSKHNLYMADNPGNKSFQDVAPVSGSSWSFVLNCDKLTKEAVAEMKKDAKQFGADTVYNARWSDTWRLTKGWNIMPTCGSFFFLFGTAHVEGAAAKIK